VLGSRYRSAALLTTTAPKRNFGERRGETSLLARRLLPGSAGVAVRSHRNCVGAVGRTERTLSIAASLMDGASGTNLTSKFSELEVAGTPLTTEDRDMLTG
jgi:hypothetical protein